MKVPSTGPKDAKILILTDVPTQKDLQAGTGLSGGTGHILTDMLHEAGIIRADCYITHVWKHPHNRKRMNDLFVTKGDTYDRWIPKPQLQSAIDELYEEIRRIVPNIIIALGDLSLWAVTKDKISVSKWRGSNLLSRMLTPEHSSEGLRIKVCPTYHPAQINTMWSWRYQVVNDLKRAKGESGTPEFHDPDAGRIYHINPTGPQALDFLKATFAELEIRETLVSQDIETIGRHIATSGIALSSTEGMCIPFISKEKLEGHYDLDTEFEIIKLHKQIFQHPNCLTIGQNWSYDIQYLVRYWAFMAKPAYDTMLMWATLFPGEPKSLNFICSMLVDNYVYWKDELKDYNKYPADETTFWKYNVKDVMYTYEITPKLITLLDKYELNSQYQELLSLFIPVLRMMLRGVNIDQKLKASMSMQLWDLMTEREVYFQELMPWAMSTKKNAKLWYRSPQQLQRVFYEELGLPVQKNKKTKRPSVDDAALKVLAAKEPAVRPLISKLQEYRSLGVFKSTFADAALDADGRMRCSFGIAGTETFRFNSKKSVFGPGMNMQNLPKGNE